LRYPLGYPRGRSLPEPRGERREPVADPPEVLG
jgi:hypothetical protein